MALLIIIITVKVQGMKKFSYLLLQCCCIDFLLSIITFIVKPVITIYESRMYNLTGGYLRAFGGVVEMLGITIWQIFFFFTICSMPVSFVFRYRVLCQNANISIKFYFSSLAISFLCASTFGIIVFFTQYIPGKDVAYLADTKLKWLLADDEGKVLAVSVGQGLLAQILTFMDCFILTTVSYGIIIVCNIKILKFLKDQQHVLSPATKKLQRDLNRTLTAQALIPVFVAFLPLGIQLAGIVPEWDLALFTFIAGCFFPWIPVCNAVSVLFFVSPYRAKIMSIFCSGGCVGIGNQMFRIASLYGIGLFPNVNRTPGLNGPEDCVKGYVKEFSETFPNVIKLVEFDDLSDKNVVKTTFGRRVYENPEVIHNVNDKYLMVNHGYLQGVRYFSYVMNEIRQLFDFHPKVKTQVEEYGNQLFISDTVSHKMCVHIRRGDFIGHRLLETKQDFLIPAMATVRKFLLDKYPQKDISLIFLTTDWKFVDSLEFPEEDYFNIYRPNLHSRAEVMYFGIRYCDSLLNSASGSTFSTWIGLLMPEEKDVFYNRRVFKDISEDIGKDYVDYERFPKHWNILELDESNKTVVIDNRWNFERYKKPNL